MARILRNLVLLTLVVQLILPVGWCCRSANAAITTASVNTGIQKSCCHRQAPLENPGGPHFPGPTDSKCCCSNDSVAPEKAALIGDVDSLAAFSQVVPAVDVPRYELHLVDRRAFQAGPRLNLLLCVWLC